MSAKILKLGIAFVFVILFLSFVSAYMRTDPAYTQYTVRGGDFEGDMCQDNQDFLVQIAPAGCTPSVVRSDLLEEQNVPVFCQLSATKMNPLIDVEAIERINFAGEYPAAVEGIGFHPAQSALGVNGDLNNPILENIGYAVIVLKQQDNASVMPDYVTGNLTARLK